MLPRWLTGPTVVKTRDSIPPINQELRGSYLDIQKKKSLSIFLSLSFPCVIKSLLFLSYSCRFPRACSYHQLGPIQLPHLLRASSFPSPLPSPTLRRRSCIRYVPGRHFHQIQNANHNLFPPFHSICTAKRQTRSHLYHQGNFHSDPVLHCGWSRWLLCRHRWSSFRLGQGAVADRREGCLFWNN